MPIQSPQTLHKSLAQKQFTPFYLLYGEDILPLQQSLHQLLEQSGATAMDRLNLTRLEEKGCSLSAIEELYNAVPMFAPYRCIVCCDWAMEKLSKQELAKLEALFADPNPQTLLIVCFVNTDWDPQKNATAKKLQSLFADHGTVCAFDPPSAAALRKECIAYCAKHQVTLPSAAAEQFLARCGTERTLLWQELDKLIAYVGASGIIEPNHIEQLCSVSLQDTAFSLCDAVLARQFSKAFVLLQHLYDLRTEPLMIVGALTMALTDLYRVKAAQASGVSQAQLQKDFHYRSAYRIRKFYGHSHTLSLPQLAACFAALQKADRRLKGSMQDSRLILEQFLAEVIAVCQDGR